MNLAMTMTPGCVKPEWGTELHPVPVCPEVLTKLLKEKGDLRSPPCEIPGPNEFKPPEYNIANDMVQASFDIRKVPQNYFVKL